MLSVDMSNFGIADSSIGTYVNKTYYVFILTAETKAHIFFKLRNAPKSKLLLQNKIRTKV